MWRERLSRLALPSIGRLEAAAGIAIFLAVTAWSAAPPAHAGAARQIAPGVCQWNGTGPSGLPITITFPCTDGQQQIDIKACPTVPDVATIAAAAAALNPPPNVQAIAAMAASLIPTPTPTPPLDLRGLTALLAGASPFTWPSTSTALYQLRAPDASGPIALVSGSLSSDTLGFVVLQACADAACSTGVREQSTAIPVWPHTQIAIPFGTAGPGAGLYLKFFTIVNGVPTAIPMTTTGRAVILP